MKNQSKSTSASLKTMGQRSNVTKSQVNNFLKARNPQNPTVDNVSDNDDTDSKDEDFLEQGFFFLDEGTLLEDDDGSDSDDDDDEVDEDELNKLQNEADIEHFNAVLIHAQAMAVKAEHEAAGEKPKRKQHYTGNSDCTNSMFIKKPTPNITEESKMPPNIIEISDNSDLDEDNDEIEASLKELFHGQSENQSHHIPLRVKTQQQQLENKLRNCFNNFEQVDAPRTTVLKWPLIRF
ncbi:hypothetical protein L208DRAFT_1382502 [Tricholoma matsutake]|nr:hypothetical protein L208DRAFT_1382502 [Tricholoma matsutake 945]